jgi:hypothetical protein
MLERNAPLASKVMFASFIIKKKFSIIAVGLRGRLNMAKVSLSYVLQVVSSAAVRVSGTA